MWRTSNTNNFDKNYPLFTKYFTDDEVKVNMVNNKDLLRKYSDYEQSIKAFVFELDKRFDTNLVNKIVTDTVLKQPDNILISIITSYLNSSEDTKSNPEFVRFFNETSNFGKESLNFIEENGIITNRKFKEIPYLALESHYIKVRTGNESYLNEELKNIYSYLNYNERKFVNALIDNHDFHLLELLFSPFGISLQDLVKVLSSNNINEIIINHDLINSLSPTTLIKLVGLMLEENVNTYTINRNIKVLKNNNKLDILKCLIDKDLVKELSLLREDEIISLNYEHIDDLNNKFESLLVLKED